MGPDTLANAFGIYAADQGFPPLIQAADGNLYGTAWLGRSDPSLRLSSVWSSRRHYRGCLVGRHLHAYLELLLQRAYRLACKSAFNDPTWTTQASTVTATNSTLRLGLAGARAAVLPVILLP